MQGKNSCLARAYPDRV